jgi:hypothetical protein
LVSADCESYGKNGAYGNCVFRLQAD